MVYPGVGRATLLAWFFCLFSFATFRLFYFMYVNVLLACMYVHHMCLVTVEVRRGHWIPGTGIKDGCMWMLEIEHRPSARATGKLLSPHSRPPARLLTIVRVSNNTRSGLLSLAHDQKHLKYEEIIHLSTSECTSLPHCIRSAWSPSVHSSISPYYQHVL